MIDVWKVAAPHPDAVAPDIYNRDPRAYAAYLKLYDRPDNPLMVPEPGNAAVYARFLWSVLGRGGIGFAPFGFDDTGYVNYPLGTKVVDEATVAAFGEKDSPWLKTDPHPTEDQPVGGVAVVQVAPDAFVVAGSDVRVRFDLAAPGKGENSQLLRVEEGSFDAAGAWRGTRVWNGDQTDYGLNLTRPTLIRVTLGTYR